MYKKGDFHIHSTFSDGSYTPKEIVILSKKRNIDIISLTDHNSTCGIDEAISFGEELGIKVIPGVELSTFYNNSKVHVLGYFKDDSYKNELLTKILKDVKNHNLSPIRDLLGKYIDFRKVKNRLHVKTGIEILKLFGAVAVLAHPVLLSKSDSNDIINLNFDGIEAKYFINTEEETEYYLKTAKNRNLLYTAGSDFHHYKEHHKKHGIIGDVYLTEKEIYNFLVKSKLPYL